MLTTIAKRSFCRWNQNILKSINPVQSKLFKNLYYNGLHLNSTCSHSISILLFNY